MGSRKVKQEMYVCFRAMRTKAAPGKGRELRSKWKNLSWVLENLGFTGVLSCCGMESSL